MRALIALDGALRERAFEFLRVGDLDAGGALRERALERRRRDLLRLRGDDALDEGVPRSGRRCSGGNGGIHP